MRVRREMPWPPPDRRLRWPGGRPVRSLLSNILFGILITLQSGETSQSAKDGCAVVADGMRANCMDEEIAFRQGDGPHPILVLQFDAILRRCRVAAQRTVRLFLDDDASGWRELRSKMPAKSLVRRHSNVINPGWFLVFREWNGYRWILFAIERKRARSEGCRREPRCEVLRRQQGRPGQAGVGPAPDGGRWRSRPASAVTGLPPVDLTFNVRGLDHR